MKLINFEELRGGRKKERKTNPKFPSWERVASSDNSDKKKVPSGDHTGKSWSYSDFIFIKRKIY